MQTILIMCAGIAVGKLLFPRRWAVGNGALQTVLTILLIFTMGVSIGRNENLLQNLGSIGLASVAFCLLSMAGSVAVVYLSTRRIFPRQAGPGAAGGVTLPRKNRMVQAALAALLLGALCGVLGLGGAPLRFLVDSSDAVLNLLMLSVGIGIGMQTGVLERLKRYHIKALIIPAGVVIGSLLGGVAGAAVTGYPLSEGLAIASCMGWYSLGGVTIEAASGSLYGGVAFLANLLREILSFFTIPLLAKYLNPPTCIAVAGATSEDTTLPMVMKYTSEEFVVLSVLNGALCSFLVPILISLCYAVG